MREAGPLACSSFQHSKVELPTLSAPTAIGVKKQKQFLWLFATRVHNANQGP